MFWLIVLDRLTLLFTARLSLRGRTTVDGIHFVHGVRFIQQLSQVMHVLVSVLVICRPGWSAKVIIYYPSTLLSA